MKDATIKLNDAATNQCHLRLANLGDADSLAALDARCFSAHDAFSVACYRRLLASPTVRIGVAVSSQGAALSGSAVLLFRHRCGHARIYSLSVDAPFRGSGLATLLLNWCRIQCARPPLIKHSSSRILRYQKPQALQLEVR